MKRLIIFLLLLAGSFCLTAGGPDYDNNRLHLAAPAADTLLSPNTVTGWPSNFQKYYGNAMYAIYMRGFGPGLDTLLPPSTVTGWPSSFQYYYGNALYQIYLRQTTIAGGNLSGTLTATHIPVASAAHTLTDSPILYSAGVVTIPGSTSVQIASGGSKAFFIGADKGYEFLSTGTGLNQITQSATLGVVIEDSNKITFSTDTLRFPTNPHIDSVWTCVDAKGDGAWKPLPPSGISGGGTLNRIPLYTPNGTTLGNSHLLQQGAAIKMDARVQFTGPDTNWGVAFSPGGDTMRIGKDSSRTRISISRDSMQLTVKGKGLNAAIFAMDSIQAKLSMEGKLHLNFTIPGGGIDNLLAVNPTDGSMEQVLQSAIGTNYLNDTIGGSGATPQLATATELATKQSVKPAYTPYGNVMNNDFSSSDWTSYGSPTVTYSGSGITISGSTLPILSSGITFTKNNLHCAGNRVSFSFDFIVGTKGSTTYGPAVYFQSTNSLGYYWDYGIYYDVSTSGAANSLSLYGTATVGGLRDSLISTHSSVMTSSAGDTVRISGFQTNDYLTYSCRNLTTNTKSPTYTYQFNPYTYPKQAGTMYMKNTCVFSIANLGGTNKIVRNGIYYYEPTNPVLAYIGDSRLQGYFVEFFLNMLWNITNPDQDKIDLFCGSSDATADGVKDTQEVKLIAPKNIVYNLGVNDVTTGVAPTTYKANVDTTIRAYGRIPGCKTYILLLAPNGQPNTVVAFNNWVKATYPTQYIDDYTPLVDADGHLLPQYDCGDGLHMNALGQIVIKQAILAKIGPIFN
jgi:lysophospholipase L1-like esterase